MGNCTAFAAPCASLNYAAAQAASGDTVTVFGGTYSVPVAPNNLLELVSIQGKTLTIQGVTKGECIFMSAATTSLLQWDSVNTWVATHLTISQLNFKQGRTHSGKPFVGLTASDNLQTAAFGSLTFIETSFEQIQVNNTEPGLIRVAQNAEVDLTLTNCVFDTIRPRTAGGAGGALVWGPVAPGAQLSISAPRTTADSPTGVFRKCLGRNGGAIALLGTWGRQVQISNVLFEENSADSAGGALSTLSTTEQGNPANQLRLFGCTFRNNIQGTGNTVDATNYGGGALAFSQGQIEISGNPSTDPCLFAGNTFQRQATTASPSRGGSAIRVTTTTALATFNVTDCIFSANSATLLNSIGAPIFFHGSLAHLTAMTTKPTLVRTTFLDNVVVTSDSSASGLQFIITDDTVSPTSANACIVEACTFSSANAERYDVIFTGAVVISGPLTSLGRIKALTNGKLIVLQGAQLTLQPPSPTMAVMGASLDNEIGGTLLISESAQLSGTVVNNGILQISRSVTALAPLVLGSTSSLRFGVRSATDFGRLTIGSALPLSLAGGIVGVSEGGFTPTAAVEMDVIDATDGGAVSGSFSSSSCLGLPGSCSVAVTSEGKVVFTSGGDEGGAPIGAIVGGVVGGVLGLALLVIIIALIVRSKKSDTVRSQVELPNEAFDPASDARGSSLIAPKGGKATRIRAQSCSGDPSVDASLNRVATTAS